MQTRLFTDADNTLWDTDAVYAAAQLSLGRQVAALASNSTFLNSEDAAAIAFVRIHDQRLATDHVDGLRYPPMLLAKTLHISLGGDGIEACLIDAVESYLVVLRSQPALRAGVREAFPDLASAFGRLVVVTETSESRCVSLLDEHGLGIYVDRIVCGEKTPSLYGQLRDVGSADVMIGDQLDRDIGYAQVSGFQGVLFASGFAPFWTSDLDILPNFSISDFRDLLPLLASHASARPFAIADSAQSRDCC